MYDPCTVAHEIRYPWAKHVTPLKDGSVHKYHEPIVTIWHVDPEAPGRGNRKDDSCGWFRPPMTEGERVRIREIGEREWGDIFGKRRAIQEGASYASVCYEPSTYDAIYWAWRRIKHEEQKRVIWKYGTRPTRGELHEIYELASSPVDNLRVSVREVNSAEACGAFFLTVYRCYRRYHRPWWRHPRWHVHHWRLQIHPWQKFKRWAFERCADCGKGFAWGYSPWGHMNDDRRYHTDCGPRAHSPLTAQLEEGERMSDIMTVDDVRKRIADIVAMAGDPEAAHAAEDALWADVLAAIAGGHSNASLLAKEALKTSAIEFARWCA